MGEYFGIQKGEGEEKGGLVYLYGGGQLISADALRECVGPMIWTKLFGDMGEIGMNVCFGPRGQFYHFP